MVIRLIQWGICKGWADKQIQAIHMNPILDQVRDWVTQWYVAWRLTACLVHESSGFMNERSGINQRTAKYCTERILSTLRL